MTTTHVIHPIIAALVAAESEIGANRTWAPTNQIQEKFLSTSFSLGRADLSRIPEIEGISSRNHEVINSFFRERGFSIEIDPLSPPDFAAASALKLAIEWSERGEETQFRIAPGGQTYPAIRMKSKGIRFYESSPHPHPIVLIPTKSGDEVYISKMDEAVGQNQLGEAALRLMGDMRNHPDRFAGLTFPMVDLDHQPDISWLVGMNTMGTDGLPAIISQALQQTKLAMDEKGARVESAVAILVSRGVGGPQHYFVDGPFLMVIKRPGIDRPIFIGYIDTDCWKKPSH